MKSKIYQFHTEFVLSLGRESQKDKDFLKQLSFQADELGIPNKVVTANGEVIGLTIPLKKVNILKYLS